MTRDRLFLLGTGNQRCGTTWLHRYLSQNDNFDSGFAKEYHIWDAVDTSVKKASYIGFRKAVSGDSRDRRRYLMQKFPGYYFKYFSGIYGETINVSGDISPSYSGLDTDRLEFIRDNFSRRGIAAKAVILIRDPLERIRSAVRLNLSRGRDSEGISRNETDYMRALENYYTSDHCRLRTCYQFGISNAWKAFGPSNVFVGIYESMFQPEEVERLSEFCGVAANSDFAKVRVNAVRGSDEDSGDLDRRIREEYRVTYDFCFENFPTTRDLWAQERERP